MNEELDEKVGPKIIKSDAKRTWGGARPNTGGRRPGSGRKKGTPNMVTAEIKEMAQKYGPEAIAELARLATRPRARRRVWRPSRNFSTVVMVALCSRSKEQ